MIVNDGMDIEGSSHVLF